VQDPPHDLAATRIRDARGWREAPVIVQPDMVVRWHRKGFRLYWRAISKRGDRRQPFFPLADPIGVDHSADLGHATLFLWPGPLGERIVAVGHYYSSI